MPLSTTTEIVQGLRHAVERRTPYSLVRLGDGEGALLGFPEFTHEIRFRKWMGDFFGSHADAAEDSKNLIRLIKQAIHSADVVGASTSTNEDWRSLAQRMRDIGSNPKLPIEQKVELSGLERRALGFYVGSHASRHAHRASGNIHIELERSGFLRSLLAEQPSVNIITCNNIADRLKAEFPSTKFRVTMIPGEFKFEPKASKEAWSEVEPHYPVVFERIMDRAKAGEFAEGVTLIGAGPCGKAYCHGIKRSGGIALDIGSILDHWAGRDTRSYINSLALVTFRSAIPSREESERLQDEPAPINPPEPNSSSSDPS